MMKPLFWAGAAALLAACGPLNRGGLGDTAANIARAVANGGAAPAAQPSPEMQAARPEDVRVITLRNQGRILPTIQTGANGPITTWGADEGISFSFDRGVLVASRGLGFDLMGTDLAGFHTSLAAGGGTLSRTVATMGSLDQIILRDVTCTLAAAGPENLPTLTGGTQILSRFDESCAGERLAFDNIYWTDPTGTIVRSRQAVTPSIGFIQVEEL